jgi:carbamoyl-phosphate synthase large subunit
MAEKKTTINILFLGGAKRVSLAELFIEAGKSLGADIKIFSYELTPYVPISEVATIISGKKWADPDVLDHLLSTIESCQIDIVLPFVDPSIVLAAKLKEKLKNLFIPVCDADIANIFFNKFTSDQWFKANGIPVPPFSEVPPLIAKPVTGSASKGLIFINDLNDRDKFYKRDDVDQYQVQQFIQGEEYTVDCYLDNKGKLIAAVPRKRVEVNSGESTKTITERNPRILEITKNIFESGKFRGPITIQFIQSNEDKSVYAMEINPRVGGGVLCSIKAGANFPLWMLQEYLGKELTHYDEWLEKFLMVRAYRETYFLCK